MNNRVNDDEQSIVSCAGDDSSFISLVETTNAFAAIFEFSQGTGPKTIWEIGTSQLQSFDSFRYFVINTPIPDEIFTRSQTTIISTFENINFIAIYKMLFDIQARGFTRIIAFVVGHLNNEVIQNIYHTYLDRMKELMNEFQKSTLKNVEHDLKKYALELNKTFEITNDQILEQRRSELKKYLNFFNVDISNEEDIEVVPKDIKFFTTINNDLRRISELTNFNEVFLPKFEKLYNDIIEMPYDGNVDSKANFIEPKVAIKFGVKDTFPELIKFIKNLNDEDKLSEKDNLIVDAIFHGEIFYHCAYSILSGSPLVIICNNPKLSDYIYKRLSFLIPFYKDGYVKNQKTIKPLECLRYSIVITEKLEIDENISLNVLNLIKYTYTGEKCPNNSFIRKFKNSEINYSYNVFFKMLYLNLKTESNNLLSKMSEISKSETFKTIKDDEPIHRYWIISYFNQQKLKPILTFQNMQNKNAKEISIFS